MSFLYPAFLIGALAAAIPIVLHLLRRDVAPEVPFTAVRLLRQSPIERSKRRRLRDLLLLAARVAAVLLLAAAFARPYAPGVSSSGTRIVAVDRSYSMGGPGRFERALELARDAVREAGASETVAVLAFDDRAEILAPPGSRADARAALGRLEAGFGGTRYSPVVDRAVEVAERAGGGRLIFVTDLQRAGWDDELPAELPAGWRVEVRDTGAVAVNAAVASVAVESDRVVATIANTGTSHREGQVRVEVDGRLLGTGAFSAEAGEAAEVPLEVRPPDTGVLSVSIDDPGGIPADDKRFVVLRASDAAKVAIIGSGSRGHSGFYLARALDASRGERDGLEAVLMSGTSLAQVTGGLRREEYAAVALLSTRGLDRKAREELAAFVRAGGGLLLCAAPELEGSVLSTIFQWNPPLDPIEQGSRPLALAATDPRHPIFRPFGGLSANLGQVSFDRVWRVASRGWDVVARFTDGTPAVLERDVDEGRVVLFASDVDRRWNDFPLHPAFVPFAIESIRHAARDRRRTGEFTVAEAPDGTEPRPGGYRLAPDNRPIAVNVDVRESALTRMAPEEFQRMVQAAPEAPLSATGLQAERTEARQSFWWFALLFMLAALVGESFVGRR